MAMMRQGLTIAEIVWAAVPGIALERTGPGGAAQTAAPRGAQLGAPLSRRRGRTAALRGGREVPRRSMRGGLTTA
jgi:hypothetical protein